MRARKQQRFAVALDRKIELKIDRAECEVLHARDRRQFARARQTDGTVSSNGISGSSMRMRCASDSAVRRLARPSAAAPPVRRASPRGQDLRCAKVCRCRSCTAPRSHLVAAILPTAQTAAPLPVRATASSRSRITASAPAAQTLLSKRCGRLPGTNRSDFSLMMTGGLELKAARRAVRQPQPRGAGDSG